MATKRMLSKSISISTQVNKLDLKAKLIFTWCIPHLDDYGLISNEPEVIKALVFPMTDEVSVDDITKFLEIAQSGSVRLIKEYQDCIEFLGFTNHNTLSENKKAKSKFDKIPLTLQASPETSKNPQETPRKPVLGEDRIGKVKRGKDNTTGASAGASKPKPKQSNFETKTDGAVLNKLIEMFEPVNPSFARLFPVKTQRKALDRLVVMYGIEGVTAMIQALEKINETPYAPTVTTPFELEAKLGKLKSHFAKLQSGNGKGKQIIGL